MYRDIQEHEIIEEQERKTPERVSFDLSRFEKPKTRIHERGELMKFFCEEINKSRVNTKFKPVSMARMGGILKGLKMQDLYYMKSVMEDCKKRGVSASKWFWWSLKHEKQN